MKRLLLLLLLIPLSSGLNISLDYPSTVSNGEEFLVKVDLVDLSGEFYDLKIDFIQNDRRISKIKDSTNYKSSMYYLDSAIQESGEFYIMISDAEDGLADIIVKLRNAAGTVKSFSGYSINIDGIIDSTVKENPESSRDATDSVREESKDKESKQEKIKEDKVEEKIEAIAEPEIALKPISLNPKTIKTDKNFEGHKASLGKYLFLIFSLILLTLYLIKPTKKKNEFRY